MADAGAAVEAGTQLKPVRPKPVRPERPQNKGLQPLAPVDWRSEGRFVLAQDRGGAIKGPHRVDLYWGVGAEAERLAGPMQHGGRLFYIAPREDFTYFIDSIVA